jgi:dipeptidyl-peptidase-3
MRSILTLLTAIVFVFACNPKEKGDGGLDSAEQKDADVFQWKTEQFADVGILRYKVHGFDQLSLKQKQLVYYLTQAGLAGRDMMWDQNYRHNLAIRTAFEKIFQKYSGDKGEDWDAFVVFLKRMWFSNGIHHHYSNDKFKPGFSRDWLEGALTSTETALDSNIIDMLFDPGMDAVKVNQDPNKDLVLASAVNFYGPDVTEAEVDAYYQKIIDKTDPKPISYGLNSRLVKAADGGLEEQVYYADGHYGAAIKEVVKWLEKAASVAENKAQGDALRLLIKYYKTGDLKVWDEYNIAWVEATEGDVDYINGFVEVYNDPKGYTGSYETIVQIKDFDASARMKKVAEQAEYFEKNSPIMEEHKKDDVVGITYNVVTVAGEAGDASPSTPIGVNLPNANWIRRDHGSKSVSLGNIIEAYDNASGPGLLKEFSHDKEEIERYEKHGQLAGKIHTALHEVIGHASGQLEKGVGTPAETLKNYASPLEEARADLVALYFIMDPKLIELGLMESDETAKAEYDGYLKNGYMLQLRRIEPGNSIQQAHMRNRQMVSKYTIEKGTQNGSIEVVKRDGKTYLNIVDYKKVQDIFGQLLKEVQRIKSQGDYAAAKDLFENYGVQVDREIHEEVLRRSEKLNIPPYYGFINPELKLVSSDDGKVIDVEVYYPTDFTEQMLRYSKNYAHLVNQ